MKTLVIIQIAAIASILLTGCKRDEPTVDPPPVIGEGKAVVKFENHVGNSPLTFVTEDYINANGDTFSVNTFTYYISNIVLVGVDNSIYKETESYHLIKGQDVATHSFTLKGIPGKQYKEIRFMIGVDSTRNVSGAQSGDLDPAHGMFWSWNTGYIMAKFEGTSPQSTANNNYFMFHPGGFSGPNSVLRNVTLTLPQLANVTNNIIPEITIKADALEWFKSPVTISLATDHTVHSHGAAAKKIADNYADMFTVTGVVN